VFLEAIPSSFPASLAYLVVLEDVGVQTWMMRLDAIVRSLQSLKRPGMVSWLSQGGVKPCSSKDLRVEEGRGTKMQTLEDCVDEAVDDLRKVGFSRVVGSTFMVLHRHDDVDNVPPS